MLTFTFTLQIWEITENNKKLIGDRKIVVNAYNKTEAVKAAWNKAIDSLTVHYYYAMISE